MQVPISTRELFARLIKCEAGGEGENGMKAVATTVMNRVNVAYGQYLREGRGSLRRIIEAPYEFTCLLNEIGGQPNPQTVWSNPPEQIHYDIADWALAGHKHWGAGESLWYMNPFATACPPYFPYNRSGVQFNRVNEHCFFIPTALYAQT
jgi:N-acetylmuramoyl-L-alanine amidase